jgi:hypothetical protein
MNDIKDLLIKILEESPQIAIWVLVIIYGYKVAVVGSIYGVCKFIITTIAKVFEERSKQTMEVERIKAETPKRWVFQDVIINEQAKASLESLLNEIKQESSGTSYLHSSDIEKLARAYRESKKTQP